jgi:hypothetical protein
MQRFEIELRRLAGQVDYDDIRLSFCLAQGGQDARVSYVRHNPEAGNSALLTEGGCMLVDVAVEKDDAVAVPCKLGADKDTQARLSAAALAAGK